MLKRAFSIFSRQNAVKQKAAAAAAMTTTTTTTKQTDGKLSATEIIRRAQEKVKDPKCDALKPIVWIDCEMTGLDHHNDTIIEICCLVTDKNLNLIDEQGYESVIHASKETMDAMSEWCVLHHGQSGLTEKVINSTKTREQVEQELLAYLDKYMNKGVGILAGNSVHMDRLFMLKDMPRVVDHLTYRIIDVSSVMEIAKRFNPTVANGRPKKKGAHTAREDILESIQDLVYYRGVYLKSPAEADKAAVAAFLESPAWTGTSASSKDQPADSSPKDNTEPVAPRHVAKKRKI